MTSHVHLPLILGSYPAFTIDDPSTRYIGGSECQQMLDDGYLSWLRTMIDPWLDAGFLHWHVHLPLGTATPTMQLACRAACENHPDPRIQRLPEGFKQVLHAIRARAVRVRVTAHTGWYWDLKAIGASASEILRLTVEECEYYRDVGVDMLYLDGAGAEEVCQSESNVWHDALEAAGHVIPLGIEPGPVARMAAIPSALPTLPPPLSPFLAAMPWLASRDGYRQSWDDVKPLWNGQGALTMGKDPPVGKGLELDAVYRMIQKYGQAQSVIIARHILAEAFGPPISPTEILTRARAYVPDPMPEGRFPWEAVE